MFDRAFSTLPPAAKGRVSAPPVLVGALKAVADAVAMWPEIQATTHWRFDAPGQRDALLDARIHAESTFRLA